MSMGYPVRIRAIPYVYGAKYKGRNSVIEVIFGYYGYANVVSLQLVAFCTNINE